MKIKIFFSLFITGFVTLVLFNNCGEVGTATSGEGTQYSGDPSAGFTIYNSTSSPTCLACHGADGMMEIGVDLKTFSALQIETAVRTGPGSMPIYDELDLSTTQLLDLIAYIQTL